MAQRIHWKPLIFFFVYTFLFAGLGVLLGMPITAEALTAPPLAPPDWLFPIVWTILYSLMAYAAYLVYISRDIDRGRALPPYLMQVSVKSLWPLLFFRLEWRLFAFLWLLLLLALVLITAWRFRPISHTAAWLLLPYILWLLFAGYLNLGYYILNR